MKKEKYLEMLNRSYKEVVSRDSNSATESRIAYLSGYIFDFTTYDSDADEEFASKALEVCEAILFKKTFDYIKDKDNYRWYLLMINMDFFSDKLDWGTSVRGAWFDSSPFKPTTMRSCGLYNDDMSQLLDLEFKTRDELESFIGAMLEFAKS